MNHALRLLDHRLLAPSLLQASPEVQRRARLLASLLVLFVLCNVMFMAQMILSGIPEQAVPLTVVLGFYLSSLAVVRWKGSLELATHLFVGPLLTLVLGYVARGGGVYAATTWPWSVLGVSLAYLLGGRRAGRAWFLVHALAVVTCTALALKGHQFPTLPPAGPVAAGFGVLMLTVMFISVILVYESAKEQMVRSLEASGARTRLVLDNIGDGFLLVGPDGVVTGEHSKAVEHWFGPVSGQHLWDYLCDDDKTRLRFRLGWEELVADVLPRELLVEQMPARVRRGARTFSVHYRVVGGDRVDAVVVITRDITLELAASAAEEERAEHVDLFERFARDPEGFRGFLRECRVLAEGVGASVGELQMRTLHTLKGNAAIFGASRVASWCHRLEDRVAAGEDLSDDDLHELRRRLGAVEGRFAALLDARAGQLNVEAADVDALRAAPRCAPTRPSPCWSPTSTGGAASPCAWSSSAWPSRPGASPDASGTETSRPRSTRPTCASPAGASTGSWPCAPTSCATPWTTAWSLATRGSRRASPRRPTCASRRGSTRARWSSPSPTTAAAWTGRRCGPRPGRAGCPTPPARTSWPRSSPTASAPAAR